jgi:hypothetical protein
LIAAAPYNLGVSNRIVAGNEKAEFIRNGSSVRTANPSARLRDVADAAIDNRPVIQHHDLSVLEHSVPHGLPLVPDVNYHSETARKSVARAKYYQKLVNKKHYNLIVLDHGVNGWAYLASNSHTGSG